MSRVRLLLALLLLILVGGSLPAQASRLRIFPIEGVPTPPAPVVSAASYLLWDDTYQVVLAAKDEHRRRPPASTTKIMTALVAFESGGSNRPVTVSQTAADAGESEIGLVAGETFPLHSLLTAMLVKSANDAATAVAEGAAGDVEAFVARMNAKARQLGLDDTHYVNPHGLDDPGQYSSAADLLTLARQAMAVPELARIFATTRYALPDAPDGTARVASTTNLLLSEYDGAIGVKTGFTFDAGLVLVAAAERDGRRLYAVVMGSQGVGGHFLDAAALLDYGFDEYGLVSVVAKGNRYGTLRSAGESAALIAGEDIAGLLPTDQTPIPHLDLEDGVPVVIAGGETVPTEPVELAALPGPSDVWRWFLDRFGS